MLNLNDFAFNNYPIFISIIIVDYSNKRTYKSDA